MKYENNWRQKSIENLEKHNYGDPGEGETGMVKRCLQLCKVPVGKFTVDDLRLMIGQNFAPFYLIPLAIEYLKDDIFIEATYYPGDLLTSILTVEKSFWPENKPLWSAVNDLIKNGREELAKEKIPTADFDSAFSV